MILIAARTSHLRTRHPHEHGRVTFVELFFDLVFVFAVTQLSHGFLEHLTPLGALQTSLLMVAVWWAWINTAWITNWLDPERPQVRVLLFALMAAGLLLSSSIPKAFEDRALPFAAAYVFMQLGRSLFMLWALQRHDIGNFWNFVRITAWFALSATCWIAGAFADAMTSRLGFWFVAVTIESLAPALGFWLPVLGRSTTTDWKIEGGHMAERCGLFVIIALGESVLVTGGAFAKLSWGAATLAAFSISFLGSVAMWVVYFNIGAERSSRLIASSSDPGRMARSGYTYIHILIVAGIIVTAVADELVLAHPGGHTELKAAAVIVGGPALYLLGNALFKRLSAPYLPLSHLAGLGLLALLIPAAIVAPPLALSAGTTAVLIVVAVWEWISIGRPGAKPAASGV